MAREKNAEPDAEYATRMGALSMLLNSIVAVMAGASSPTFLVEISVSFVSRMRTKRRRLPALGV
jgi:hypothetical protein